MSQKKLGMLSLDARQRYTLMVVTEVRRFRNQYFVADKCHLKPSNKTIVIR